MSLNLMRRIDSWLGKPLVALLRIFSPAPLSLLGPPLSTPPRRVLCTKFMGLGSVVLSLPLLKTLKENSIQVAFWSFPSQAELVRLSGWADEVWIIDPHPVRFFPSLLSTLWRALRFRADAFIDLEPTAHFSALLARLSLAPIRVGLMAAKPLRESLFTHLISLTPERHMGEHHLRIAELLLPDFRPNFGPNLGPTFGPLKKQALLLPPLAPPSQRSARDTPSEQIGKTIILNPNTSELSWHRLWQNNSWIEVCEALLKDPEVRLIFPGTRAEARRNQTILKGLQKTTPHAMNRVQNFAGQTSIAELLDLLAKAELVISVDSGIMHLASWLGTPLVALFGPETPHLYGPLPSTRSAQARVLWAELPCSPCLTVAAEKLTRCRDNQCMKQISPKDVIEACRVILDEKSPLRKIP